MQTIQYQISFGGKGSQARRPWPLLQTSYAIVLRNYATGADEAGKMPLNVHPGLTSWEKNAGQFDVELNKHLNFGDLYDELDQIQSQALCFKLNHRSQLPLCANYKTGENQDLAAVLSMKIPSEPGCVCPFKTDDGTISIIAVLRDNDAVSLETAFNPSVFESAAVQRFLHQLNHVFQFILSANDDFPVMEIDITSKHDQQVLRKYFPPPPKGIDCALHAVFQKHVELNPAGLAIDAHDGRMTYAELDSASSALAQVLSHAGVGPDIQVPILFEKSRWAVIAMLAVSKAGGCFVPLDASHPVQRLRTIIEQLETAVIGLASVSCESIMSRLVQNTIVASTCAANNVKSTLPHVDSQLPAYILFTSGSTGQPKGCIITHSSIATSSIMFGKQLGFLSEKPVRTFQFSSYGFDACMIDIFYTLAYGGCICIPSETARMSDVELSMREMAVTHTFLTPSVAAQVNPDAVPTLHNLILGGEKPSESLVRKWSKIVVYNAYGPTETAICSHVAEATGSGWAEGNIGKGFASTSWIVDAKNHHKQLPLGVVGELIIEGPTVARGYLHDISKTRSSFVVGVAWAEPYGDDMQRRFYKTGDLGFVDQQGMVHCIGRKDHQVKLRGVRIELEDVEAHIKKLLPGDSRAAAAVVTSADGHELLVAFVSAKSLISGSGSIAMPSPQALVSALKTLNQGLQHTCPSPMVPSAYIPLDVFPLQASGKIDRAKLKGLAKERTLQELLSSTRDSIVGRVAAPLTETEKALSLLWGEALSLDSSQLGADSNFFEEGGNSLAAMRLAQKARRQGLLLTVEAIFRHPTLSEMAQLSKVNQLHVPVKSSALSILSREENRCTEVAIKEIATQCGLPVGDIECAFPCTTLQESLFALSTKVPGSYIMHFTLKVNADVAIPGLVKAFEEIYSSSSILRTRICQSSSGLVQVVIRSDCALREQIIATNGLPNADASIRNGIQEMSLGKPLSKVMVVTKEKKTYLTWSIAHVLADGYSMSSYLEKITSCYEMRQMSSRIDAKPVSSLFEDFSRSVAHELDGDASKEFWTGYLRDATATPWPVLKTPSFQSQTNDCLELPFESTPRCSSAFTLSTIARAAWALTLSRYTGAQDVIFAATTNGRLSPIANVELVDGPTITTIPVRVNIDFNKTVGQMLQQLTYDVADSIPFEQYGLQRISQIDHSIKDICSTQNTLVVQPEDVLAQDLPWLDQISMDMTFPQALMLECILGKGGFRLRATFDNRVIARDDMHSTLSLFSQIFTCLQTPRAVDMPVRDLPSISTMDEALISTWSAKNAVRVPTCVHDLFQRQALLTPQKQAIEAWDGSLTYAELNSLSTAISQQICNMQSSMSTSYIPVCYEKSIWAVVIMLGVLKSGHACVPLDAALPSVRMSAILQDIDATFILSSPEKAVLLEDAVIDVPLIVLDGKTICAMPLDDSRAVPWTKPTDPAWCVFTSGSTGQPKGIILAHDALCTGAHYHGHYLGLTPDSRVFNFAAFSFDVSFADIFFTLLSGGTVCMPSEISRLNNLAEAIRTLRSNHVYLTSSVAGTLSPAEVPCVRTLAVGGEAVNAHIAKTWADETRLINIYGPAEVTVWCTAVDMMSKSADPRNIGFGLGASVWITEPGNPEKLMPIGAIGELLVGGPLLAIGYLKNPVKTTAAFIKPPTWMTLEQKRQHKTLYRSGDLVAFSRDGSIKYIGRLDTQIKLRGQRIELAEIEAVLRSLLPDFEIPVELIHANNGRAGLAAFITRDALAYYANYTDDSGKDLTEFAKRASLALEDRLPTYMVVRTFIPLDTLPISPNGKLDRKMLRHIGSQLSMEKIASFTTERANEAPLPTTHGQRLLARLWSTILDVQDVRVDDNFLRLGGDSVSAMKLVSAARKENLRLTMKQIFEHPSLSGMSDCLEEAEAMEPLEIKPFELAPAPTEVTDIIGNFRRFLNDPTFSIGDIYPASPLQEGLVAGSHRTPGTYIMQKEYSLPGSLDITRFRAAWRSVIARVAILRTRFFVHSEKTWQLVNNHSMAWDDISAPEKDVYIQRMRTEMSFIGSPTIRLAVVPSEGAMLPSFIISMHHAIYDGVSLNKIWSSVERAYKFDNTTSCGSPYVNFVRHLLDVDLSAAKSYWSNYLDGISCNAFPTHPSTRYTPRPQSTFHVDAPAMQQGHESTTPASILQTAWALTISEYACSDEVVFGMVVSGRDALVHGIEDMLGPVISTIPVRASFADRAESSISDVTYSIQKASSESAQHQILGLHSISQLSHDARKACDFHNVLVVQPQELALENTLGLDLTKDHSRSFLGYALAVECSLSSRCTRIMTYFDEDIIAPKQIRRMISHFTYLVQRLSQEPHLRLADVSGASPNDIEDIAKWNDPPSVAVNKTLHELLDRHVLERPNSIALRTTGMAMSYHQLDSFVHKLASHLVGSGLLPNSVVPVFCKRSPWTIVTFLAISKCGCIFVPFDPTQPINRLQYMVNELGEKLFIVTVDHMPNLHNFFSHQNIVTVDSSLLKSLPEATYKLPHYNPSDLAYILFTSGSTGQPKGVKISNQAIATSVMEGGASMGFSPDCRMLQFSAYTFDVSILEIFFTLAYGGAVCIVSETERLSDLAGAFQRMQVTRMLCTPSVLATLTESDIGCLDTVMVAGEKIPEDIFDYWSTRVRLINAYGPTEFSVICTMATAEPGRIPNDIGRGVASACWVVDSNNSDRLVPIGAVGELLMQGPLCADGYLNDEAKTRNSFISTPRWMSKVSSDWSTYPKFYKTGDLVKYQPDGTLAFLHRKDSQVKLRGQRFELGEVDSCLQQCLPSRIKGIVELVETRDGKRALAGFLCSKTPRKMDRQPTTVFIDDKDAPIFQVYFGDAERSHLEVQMQRQLPSFMVPSLWIFLEDFPLFSFGKVNRKLLRVACKSFSMLNLQQIMSTPTEIAVLTVNESILQQMWAKVLRIAPEAISRDSQFFRLGADSISAMKLASLARSSGYHLPVDIIFAENTLSGMAGHQSFSHVPAEQSAPPPFSLIGDVDFTIAEAQLQCDVSSEQIEDIYPATPLQQDLLAVTAKDGNAYISRQIWHLPAVIDLPRFKGSWETLVQKTAALRTRFVTLPSQIVQVVTSQSMPTVWQRADSLKEYIRRDQMSRGRTVSGSQILGLGLVRERSKSSLKFVFTWHHALYDGRSMALLMQDLLDIYQGTPPVSSSPSISPFIKYLSETPREPGLAYWRTTFKDAAPGAFPFERRTVHDQSLGLVESRLSWVSAQPDSRRIPHYIQAAWATVIGIYSNVDDVSFGITLHGRNLPVIGLGDMRFPALSTVPVRVRLDRDMTTLALVKQLKKQETSMRDFQNLGIAAIRRTSDAAHDACNFQSHLIIQGLQEEPGLLQETFGNIEEDTNVKMDTYPLNVECHLQTGGVLLQLRYDTSILTCERANLLLSHFRQALSYFENNGPPKKIKNLNLCTPEDLQMISQWNGAVPELEPFRSINHAFEEMVQNRPDAPAVFAWDGTLSYAQLDSFSTALAMKLRALGIKTGANVPLCFEKSMFAIISMFAVFKAGGTIVPMDPSHPAARLEAIVEDTMASVVLCSSKNSSVLSTTAKVLVVDSDACTPSSTSCSSGSWDTTPETAAYIIFTSGSTGKAKGVVIEHGQYCSGAYARTRATWSLQSPRVLQFSSYAFDLSLEDILNTLMFGGTVCICSDQDRLDPEALTRFMNHAKVNVANLTPSFATLLDPSNLPDMKIISLGGEQATKEVYKKWANRVQTLNGYGPTECSVTSVVNWTVTPDSDPRDIGRGAGARTWIVDPSDHNKLSPVGAIGELLLDGPCVARGYLNDSSRTKQSFISPPSWATSLKGSRMYKTGDLVRYSTSGSIIYLGRKDSQIKIRGHRVELEGIEARIRFHLPSNTQVVVETLKMAGAEDSILIGAFIVLSNPWGVTEETDSVILTTEEARDRVDDMISGIGSQLSKDLPSYMIPSIFLPISKLPMTTSSKVDRSMLRKEGSAFLSVFRQKARTAIQRPPISIEAKTLQQLWAKVLNVSASNVGLDDNFLHCGGDSISAMRLVAAARMNGWLLTVGDIFRSASLEELSGYMHTAENTCVPEIAKFALLPAELRGRSALDTENIVRSMSQMINLENCSIEDAYPCTSFQEDMIRRTIQRPGAVTMRFIYSTKGADMEKLRSAFEKCCTYASLRTRIVQYKGHFLQVVLSEGPRMRQHTNLDELLAEDSLSPMNLGTELSRCCCVVDGLGQPQSLVWTFNHSIYDGWQMMQLQHELEVFYSDPGRTSAEQPQFNGFLRHLQALNQPQLSNFWRQELDGVRSEPFVAIPQNIAPSSTASRGRHIGLLESSLKGVTVATMIQLAWAVVVAQRSGSDDVLLELTVTGRNAPVPNIERLIAPTAATIPFRITLSRKDSVRQALHALQEKLHSITPYEQAGWASIRNLSDGIASRMDCSVPFIIHPFHGKEEDAGSEAWFQLEPAAIVPTVPHDVAFQIDCSLGVDGVDADATFDPRIIRNEEVDLVLICFENVLTSVLNADTVMEVGCLFQTV